MAADKKRSTLTGEQGIDLPNGKRESDEPRDPGAEQRKAAKMQKLQELFDRGEVEEWLIELDAVSDKEREVAEASGAPGAARDYS